MRFAGLSPVSERLHRPDLGLLLSSGRLVFSGRAGRRATPVDHAITARPPSWRSLSCHHNQLKCTGLPGLTALQEYEYADTVPRGPVKPISH